MARAHSLFPPTGSYYPQSQPSNGREYPGTARQEPVYTGGFAPQEPYQGDYAPMQGGYLYEEYADQRQLNTVNAEGKRPKKSKIFGRKADRAAADAPDATPVQESAWPPVAPEEEEAPLGAYPLAAPLRQMMLLPCLPSPRPSPWPRRPITHRLHAMQQATTEAIPQEPYLAPVAQVEPPQPPVGQATQPTVQQQETRLQGRFQQDAPATSATMRVPVLQQEKRPQRFGILSLSCPLDGRDGGRAR